MDLSDVKIKLKEQIDTLKENEELDFYLHNAYYDLPFFLKAITENHSSVYNYFGDMQKDLFYVSDNMRDDFGFEHNLVIDFLSEWRKRIHGEKWKKAYDLQHDSLMGQKNDCYDLRYKVENKNGEVFWMHCCGKMKWSEDRSVPLYLAGRVSKQSETFIVDPVTNFPIHDTMQNCLNERQKNGDEFWTIGFCLNHMFKINTIHSRIFADGLIHDISRTLTDELGEHMTFYRLPGVRCIAVPDFDLDRDEIIQKIREIIELKYRNAGVLVDNPSSFVAMRFPQPGWSIEDFQENMVALLKLARHGKQNEYIGNSDENIARIRTMSNMSMKITADVLNDMENFRAVVQPIVSAETGKIIGGETLMRWKVMSQDISPAVFIPILEKGRMIYIAGRWILEQAVKACAEIVKIQKDFYLTVNVSLQQIYDEEFIPFISKVLDKYQLEGKHIVLEMTESCMDTDPERLMALIKECKRLAIKMALDDFGTGYSSLRVLMKYPTDIIKIDRSLLLEMEESEEKNGFITSLVDACHKLGKKICVEGVETKEQDEVVKKGCGDVIQGFYYYRPIELAELMEKIC